MSLAPWHTPELSRSLQYSRRHSGRISRANLEKEINMGTNPKGRTLIMRGESRAAGAEQRLKELGIQIHAPPERSGTQVEAVQSGNLLFLNGMLPSEGHGAKFIVRVDAELDVEAGRKAAHLRGAQRPRCRAAAFGVARQSQARRSPRRVGGHSGGCSRTAQNRGPCFGVAARRLRKGQESLSPGVWSRKPSARHPGRVGSDL